MIVDKKLVVDHMQLFLCPLSYCLQHPLKHSLTYHMPKGQQLCHRDPSGALQEKGNRECLQNL